MSIRKLYLGKEETAGTAVPATTIYRAEVSDIKDERTIVNPSENIGYIPKLTRAYTSQLLSTYTMPDHEATFEQLPYLLNAGITADSPTQDGGGGYIRPYAFPTTAEKTIDTYTLESRNVTEPIEMSFGFVSEFTMSGVAGEAWKITGAKWNGRQSTVTTFTGDLAVPTVEEMLFQKTKLYLDAYDGTLGATVKTGTLLGATINVVTGWNPLFTGDGNLFFTRAKFFNDLMAVTGSITFEFDGIATAEEAYWKAGTPRLMRLLTEGSTLAVAGTVYSKKTSIFECALLWTGFSELESRDGNDVVTLDFEARLVPDKLFAQFVNVNALATLP